MTPGNASRKVPPNAMSQTSCQLHIGLDGQAYNAFKERWDDVEAIARRTLWVAEGSPRAS